MATNKKSLLKAAWFITLFFLAIVFGVLAYIKNDNSFKVVHFQEEKTVTGPDGRTSAGSPEVYKIEASPAVSWKLVKGDNNTWFVIGLILVAITVLYLIAYEQGIISFGASSNSPGIIPFVLLCASAGCLLGAYSSAFANNYRELSRQQYEQVKDDNKKMEALFFDGKDYIR